MVTCLINLDSEADRILSSVAGDYDGDAGRAVSGLLLAHESIELFLDEFEATNATELIRQRDNAARDFEQGLGISWDQVKPKTDCDSFVRSTRITLFPIVRISLLLLRCIR